MLPQFPYKTQCTKDLANTFEQDNVAKLLSEFATAKQKKDDLQNQFEAFPTNLGPPNFGFPFGFRCCIRATRGLDSHPRRSRSRRSRQVCSKRLVTAEKLINGLGGEKSRWQASSAKLGEQRLGRTPRAV